MSRRFRRSAPALAVLALGKLRRAKTARHVMSVAAAAHENPARPCLEIQDGHLRGIEPGRQRRDREQNSPTGGSISGQK